MKRKSRAAALCMCLILAASVAWAQQDPAELGKKVADQVRGAMQDPAAMERWQETMKTGAGHEFLQKAFVGDWNVEMRFWMDPQGEPQTAKGTAKVEPLFDGRYIRERFKGEAMGMPFEGEGTTGYDNNRKLFVSTWIDSMGTGIMTSRGSISPDGKRMVFIGEMDEPMSGEIGKAIKTVHTIDSANRHRMEMYEVLYGDEFKVMELIYTRAGSPSGS